MSFCTHGFVHCCDILMYLFQYSYCHILMYLFQCSYFDILMYLFQSSYCEILMYSFQFPVSYSLLWHSHALISVFTVARCTHSHCLILCNDNLLCSFPWSLLWHVFYSLLFSYSVFLSFSCCHSLLWHSLVHIPMFLFTAVSFSCVQSPILIPIPNCTLSHALVLSCVILLCSFPYCWLLLWPYLTVLIYSFP